MNTKQQQLTFEKGITTLPSDSVCSDNTLQDVNNLIYRDGEHHVIQNPKLIGPADGRLLFVHKLPNGEENWLYEKDFTRFENPTHNYDLRWGKETPESATFHHALRGYDNSLNPKDITAIGKTLIANIDGTLRYFIWDGSDDGSDDGGDYTDVTDSQNPDVEFFLYGEQSYAVHYSRNFDLVPTDNQETFNDLVTGIYAKNKNAIAQKKAFCLPFFIRTALEMKDGGYTHISNPILVFPSISENTSVTNVSWNGSTLKTISGDTYYQKLYYINKSKINNDLFKCIAVFISRGIEIYDTTVDQKFRYYSENSGIKHNGIYRDSIDGKSTLHAPDGSHQSVFTRRDAKEIDNDIKSTSIFYKLCELELNGDSTAHDIGEKIEVHTLENLTTRDQLEHDDYHSFCKMNARLLYTYNNRLNIAGVERSFFEGFDFFMPYDNDAKSNYNIYVTIKTDSGNVVVKHTIKDTYQKMGYYFYYPDQRATNVVIKKVVNNQETTVVLDAKLTEHPGLNGAYYYAGLNSPIQNAGGSTTVTTNPKEYLQNYLIQSEVDCPFVFYSEGYHRVGTGRILGIAAQTVALSQGQRGRFQLAVFTTEGIWAMTVDKTGIYEDANPFSREVALLNNPGITQTDGAIFFLSKKGLMLVVGKDVTCVSEQLRGKSTTDFEAYFKDCVIAYDYRDSLLWIFNAEKEPDRALVYSIKSGTFAWKEMPCNEVRHVVNNYPDYLIQELGTAHTGGTYKRFMFSLLNRENPNKDNTIYTASLKSRPLKLENAMALKSILDIRHIYDFKAEASGLTFKIFASNNLKNWVEVKSLGGTPWKYYRFEYTFNNLRASDTFAGSVLITQERRTTRLR